MGRVAKFGGTSVADAARLREVKAIVEADDQRQVVVVSAPGTSSRDPHKITDMLLMCHQLGSHGLGFQDVWSLVEKRFYDIRDELGLNTHLDEALAWTRSLIVTGATAGQVAARGEYLSGLLVASLLEREFVDAAEVIRMTRDGDLDAAATQRAIAARLPKGTRAVVPGYYGADPDGTIHTLARGGSDITGALLARGIGADLYENWTDVPGFLDADPTIVPAARPIQSLTFAELRELSYMGAQVLQEDAIFPVREARIPIHVRSTMDPDAPGTRIVATLPEDPEHPFTGIAGRQGFSVVTVEKLRMRAGGDFMRKLLSVFESNDLTVEHLPSGIDSISVVVPTAQLAPVQRKVLEEIRIYCRPERVQVDHQISLIAVVGHGFIANPGSSARMFRALADAHINVRLILQGASELCVLIGVATEDFAAATRALHAEFTRKG